jgi:hypothetical protein
MLFQVLHSSVGRDRAVFVVVILTNHFAGFLNVNVSSGLLKQWNVTTPPQVADHKRGQDDARVCLDHYWTESESQVLANYTVTKMGRVVRFYIENVSSGLLKQWNVTTPPQVADHKRGQDDAWVCLDHYWTESESQVLANNTVTKMGLVVRFYTENVSSGLLKQWNVTTPPQVADHKRGQDDAWVCLDHYWTESESQVLANNAVTKMRRFVRFYTENVSMVGRIMSASCGKIVQT